MRSKIIQIINKFKIFKILIDLFGLMNKNIIIRTKKQAMQVRQIYNILHRKTDPTGNNGNINQQQTSKNNQLQYHIMKKYEDLAQSILSREIAQGKYRRKAAQLKRGSYLEDQHRAKKFLPGPGKYQIQNQWVNKSASKLSRNKSAIKKKTYLDEAIQKSKKDNVPAPGSYNVLKRMGQEAAKGSEIRQRVKTDRIYYLDNAEYEGTLTPGVGQYDISRYERSITQSSHKHIEKSQSYWKQLSRKKSTKKPPQAPDMATYDPKPLDHELFSQKSKIKQLKPFQKSKSQRKLKTQPKNTNLGPGKYNILHQWKPKQKNTKGVLDNISKGVPKSVYYQ